MFYSTYIADTDVNSPTIFGRQLVSLECEELLVRRLVAENPVQEEVTHRRWALPTSHGIIDRLCSIEDRLNIVREFLVRAG